ncbi:ATPase, partial [mine drainage metagenome]
IAGQFLTIKPYYRLVFISLTSYVNELDEKVFLKFIQQFAQKRKSDYCTSLYLLEAGLFDKKVIDAITYMMDGSITFKSEGSKTYLKVDGLGTVRSRDWIEVFLHETTFELGAFTLEKIR